MKTRHYVNYGGGVNSTAMLILLSEENIEFEAIFVDTGAEKPETIEYVNYMIKQGYDITILKPKLPDGSDNLIEYLTNYGIVPIPKWCRYLAKIRTIQNYVKKPCTIYIGLNSNEKHRVKQVYKYKEPQIEYRFPLIERNIDENMCLRIIKNKGLKIPPKSGCVVCVNSKPEETINYMNKSEENFNRLYKYMISLSKSLLEASKPCRQK